MISSWPSLRRRTSVDLDEIVGWIPHAAALYAFGGPLLEWPLTATQMEVREGTAGFTAWVGEGSDGVKIGQFELTVADEVRVGRIVVNPELRGQGCAAIVLELALGEARRQGATRLRPNVLATNEPALRAYRRAGFVVDGALPRPDVLGMTVELSEMPASSG